MSSVRRCSFLVAAALAVAAPLSAQWKPVADAGWVPSPVASPAAATVPESTMPKASASAFVAPLPGQEPRTSRDVALMIVGGTALITGAIIGDDAGGVLMVGGTVVGLVGLYQYLR